MKKLILAALLFVYSVSLTPSAYAQSDTMGGTANAAQQTSSKDSAVQMASLIMAAALAAQCGPKNPVACIMAALAAAQAAAAGSAGKGAKHTASLQSQGPGSGSDNGTIDVGTPGADVQLDQIKTELGKKGVEVSSDGKSITLPDGRTVPLDASTVTPEGMQSNGFSADEINAAQAALAEAQEKAAKFSPVSGTEVADYGLTGGDGGGGYSSGGGASSSAKYVVRNRSAGKREAPSLSGMSKNFGTDKIGVSADHIFEMITRRYKAKEASNTFLSN